MQAILTEFEQLTEPEKEEVAAEIMRRRMQLNWPPLADDELAQIADERFTELDLEEAAASDWFESAIPQAATPTAF
ncbi:MAG: hypothetical protein ACKV0T_12200 [Planctomycetales bacterium]